MKSFQDSTLYFHFIPMFQIIHRTFLKQKMEELNLKDLLFIMGFFKLKEEFFKQFLYIYF